MNTKRLPGASKTFKKKGPLNQTANAHTSLAPCTSFNRAARALYNHRNIIRWVLLRFKTNFDPLSLRVQHGYKCLRSAFKADLLLDTADYVGRWYWPDSQNERKKTHIQELSHHVEESANDHWMVALFVHFHNSGEIGFCGKLNLLELHLYARGTEIRDHLCFMFVINRW